MDDIVAVNDAQLFATHAGNDIAMWKVAVGQRVTHTKFGDGTILEVDGSDGPGAGSVYVEIAFHEDLEKRFTSQALADPRFFSSMQLPSDVPGIEQTRERLEAERRHAKEHARQQRRLVQERIERQKWAREQRERERESAAEFAALKTKYMASRYPSDSPSDPLYPILLKLDERVPLDEENVRLLEKHDLHTALAINKENEYRRSREPWTLVKASSY